MNIALVSLHNAPYQPLGTLTWDQNKIPYADLHEYAYCCKTDGFYGVPVGFEKIYLLRDLMTIHPQIEWFWWTGCDTLITNFTTKVEDRIDSAYHFIIASDCNGINADSFLIRNSSEGHAFIDHIIAEMPRYINDNWFEQQCIIDSQEKFKDIMKIVPQRDINAYDYGLYPGCQPVDKLGTDGQWKPGDFLIHWPGTDLGRRLHLAQHYTTLITK